MGPSQDYTDESFIIGNGIGRQKIQAQLDSIYSELRRKQHDFEDENRE